MVLLVWSGNDLLINRSADQTNKHIIHRQTDGKVMMFIHTRFSLHHPALMWETEWFITATAPQTDGATVTLTHTWWIQGLFNDFQVLLEQHLFSRIGYALGWKTERKWMRHRLSWSCEGHVWKWKATIISACKQSVSMFKCPFLLGLHSPLNNKSTVKAKSTDFTQEWLSHQLEINVQQLTQNTFYKQGGCK